MNLEKNTHTQIMSGFSHPVYNPAARQTYGNRQVFKLQERRDMHLPNNTAGL